MQTVTIETSRLRGHCWVAGPAELSSKKTRLPFAFELDFWLTRGGFELAISTLIG